MESQNDLFVGLDVGSSQVRCVVARQGEKEDSFHLVGFGTSDSLGVRAGAVIDVEEAVKSIREAITNASYSAQIKIERVWASIGGGSMDSRSCVGYVALKGKEVTKDDIGVANRNAQEHAENEQKGRQLIKLIPQGYSCGDVDFVKNPIGLEGEKLVSRMQAIYGSATNAQNMRNCILRAGVELVNYEPHPWAASIGVLTPTEKKCGVAIIDIGAETTSISVFKDDFLRFCAVREWGSSIFTRDISMVLGMSWDEAETIKCLSGVCSTKGILADDVVQATQNSKRCLKRLLAKTLEARASELFNLDKKILAQAGELSNVNKVILVGGGANLSGIKDVAQSAFPGIPCVIGTPKGVENECQLKYQPEMSVAWGLIKAASGQSQLTENTKTKTWISNMAGKVKVVFLGQY